MSENASSTSSDRPILAIVQSCYIPWRGFFDMIKKVDHLVIYDDMQFVKRHWHNRNQIMTQQGPLWLSIPVQSKGKYSQQIDETMISEPWAEKHWRSIANAYGRAPYFRQYKPALEAAYETVGKFERLSDVNVHFLKMLSGMLDLQTTFSWSTEYPGEGRKTDRLLSLCKHLNARGYVSGPSAKSYFENEKFAAEGIEVEWMDYSGYPDYAQRSDQPFQPAVSILDLLLNTGPDIHGYMKPFPERKRSPTGLREGGPQ